MTLDIPNYRVFEKLGVGAQSRIYRARCMRTGQDYAVKVVKIQTPEDVRVANLLRAEHAIGSAVDHPAIRKVYELRMIRQRFRLRGAILFMEYVDGTPLSEGKLQRPMDEVLEFFVQAAGGLHAMHCAGYVHADLKPSNILVLPNDQVKLIDFGQSSRMREAKTSIQGTIHYIAPEQVRMDPLDQRTDVFGLGAALHRVLTGKPVATEMNQTVNINAPGMAGQRISRKEQPATDNLPRCVTRLIEDCCAKEPKDRLPDMPAFIKRAQMAQAILRRPPSAGDTEYDDDLDLEVELEEELDLDEEFDPDLLADDLP